MAISEKLKSQTAAVKVENIAKNLEYDLQITENEIDFILQDAVEIPVVVHCNGGLFWSREQ